MQSCYNRAEVIYLKAMPLVRKYAMIIAGNFLLAFGVVFFILPNHILSGGVASVAMILGSLLPLSEVTLISLLNILLFCIGALFLGKRFALNSLVSTILYPLFVSLLSMLDTDPFAHVDALLAALYGGLLCGLGLGLVFRVHASTGGMDIPALIIHKYAGLPQGTSVMIVDTLTIASGLGIFGVNSVLTGLLGIFASSFAINWSQTLGAQSAKNVLIISDHWQQIEEYLLQEVSRGVTILEGQGAWSKKEKKVLMCVVSNREYGRIEAKVGSIDPKAFIIVTDVHEVRGSGFTYKDGTI